MQELEQCNSWYCRRLRVPIARLTTILCGTPLATPTHGRPVCEDEHVASPTRRGIDSTSELPILYWWRFGRRHRGARAWGPRRLQRDKPSYCGHARTPGPSTSRSLKVESCSRPVLSFWPEAKACPGTTSAPAKIRVDGPVRKSVPNYSSVSSSLAPNFTPDVPRSCSYSCQSSASCN